MLIRVAMQGCWKDFRYQSSDFMPAQKPIRRSQLISPFGIGAMVDFPRDEALMTAGLDAWPRAKEPCPPDAGWLIVEERLQARLGVTHFRQPPDHREPERGEKFALQKVPFLRFPRWHYCHQCGGMELVSLFSSTRQRCPGRPYDVKNCAGKPEKKRPYMIPVRFVAVCEDGHIQDFPFYEFIHRDQPFDQATHKLRLLEGRSSAGLTGIAIQCSCDAKRVLGDVFKWDEKQGGPLAKIGCNCRGLRPWLGEQDTTHLEAPGCGKALRVVQRGASNVYFPHIVSSLYLPLWASSADEREIIEALEQPHVWRTLTQITVGGRIDPQTCQTIGGMLGLDPEKLRVASQHKLDGIADARTSAATQDEEQFRHSEFQALTEARGTSKSELFVEPADLKAYSPDVARFFKRIQLVHKLRETRALAGFTRLLPPDGNLASERLRELKLDKRAVDWLPAVKVYGEGIFLELNDEQVRLWLASEVEIDRRSGDLRSHYNTARTDRHQPFRAISPKFVLLHTLAHVLINQLSYDCGYGSASLRERLYCDVAHTEEPMSGLLIYTASGDSEGTMGGLVRQGRPSRLEPTLRRAMSHASWCSADPVCIESNGQGPDNANLAACHGCCLLPETSCEEGNRILDRAMLVGIPENPRIGFFNELQA
jgi:Domain of unknown function (DUF1998)